MYSWTPSPLANLHHPHQMSLGFLLHSVFWIICPQNKGAQWLDPDWLLLAVFPLGQFAHHLSTFGHLTSLCTECFSLFLHLHFSDYSPAWCLWLGKQHAYANNSSPLSAKAHLGQRLLLASTQACPHPQLRAGRV